MPNRRNEDPASVLAESLRLPCGAELGNRVAKAAMSDSLGDGRGDPTVAQARLYRRWADGGAALSIIGEVQVDRSFPERPGNLVLDDRSDLDRLRSLARAGTVDGAHLWCQLGHGGALADARISDPAGPSALHLDGLECRAMEPDQIERIPGRFADAAGLARRVGFTGVEIHAAHGFLFSQFLSPLFNYRNDRYGGTIENRSRLLVSTIDAVRDAVGTDFPIGVKINATDQIDGGLIERDALAVIEILNETEIDLVDISGGTYFPGAASSSERPSGDGPYFVDVAARAREVCDKPIMATGGFKTRAAAAEAVAAGAVDVVGMARALVLEPDLPRRWFDAGPVPDDVEFPQLVRSGPGAVTAWYTMRLAALGEDREVDFDMTAAEALTRYEERDAERIDGWLRCAAGPTSATGGVRCATPP
jgi:2,4-dienoyl-CoA reductase-like NADH-dependent reductase (Old Yellow Enzyme family)